MARNRHAEIQQELIRILVELRIVMANQEPGWRCGNHQTLAYNAINGNFKYWRVVPMTSIKRSYGFMFYIHRYNVLVPTISWVKRGSPGTEHLPPDPDNFHPDNLVVDTWARWNDPKLRVGRLGYVMSLYHATRDQFMPTAWQIWKGGSF
jgi:hypothetical protein